MGAPQEENDPNQTLKIITYIFAGLSMMLNIRLCYSAAPYALLRFKLPENLFSIFVRKMASALELWCLPSMFLGNLIELIDKYIIDGGHKQRQYEDAPKYDITSTGSLGSRLKHKAEELQNAANKLKDKAQSESVGGQLETHARDLATNAGLLSTDPSNADKVITEFEKVETEYNTAGANQPKVKSEFDFVKHLYSRILNVKKSTKLKAEAGETDLAGLRQKADNLSTNATSLAGALIGDDLATQTAKDLVNKLKNAATSLKELLTDLHGAPDSNDQDKAKLVEKAQAVKSKYNEVESAYNAVAANTTATGKKTEFGNVQSAFQALEAGFKGQWNNITLIYDKPVIRYQSIFWNWCNFFTFVILFIVFITGGDQGHVTLFYWIIAASGFVFGIYMVFVYAMEWWFLNWYMVGENSFPVVTSFMHYVSILIFGNRRKWNTDYIAVIIDMVISMCIAFTAAVLWTYCYYEPPPFDYNAPSNINPEIASPVIMVLVGMGIVYAIYPAIAPGMIVPFYLIDKIEMVLLIMTCFPPVIVALVCREKYEYSPKAPWKYPSVPWVQTANNTFWHTFIFIPPLQICLTAVLLYSLHYRDSSIARSIINQPKMSTFLSIVFYMCHEIQLALGFPGMVGNNGGDVVMLPTQYVGALLMVFLAFYSEGYITEYKRYEPSHWPTTGMTKWNAFCYWCKRASKITIHILKSLFIEFHDVLFSFTHLFTPLHIYIK